MKLYKITLNISSIIFIILATLSIVLTILENNNAWYNLIINYTVGITCSILVVIITTWIQFKIEQIKLLNIVLNRANILFIKLNEIYNALLLTETKTTDKSEELSQLCFEISKACLDLKFYSKKEQNKIDRIFVYSFELKKQIDNNGLGYTENILKIFESDKLIQLGDNAVSLRYKDGCQADIKEELEAIKTRKLYEQSTTH